MRKNPSLQLATLSVLDGLEFGPNADTTHVLPLFKLVNHGPALATKTTKGLALLNVPGANSTLQ
eukprot:3906928-Heterocapsa_arctica.AAC.1